jgi:hypothetical protein
MSLECSGIACVGESICEVSSGTVSARVDIEQVRRVTLGYGFQSSRRIRQTAFGLILLIPGIWGVFHLLHWAIFGGTLVALEGWLSGFILLGSLLVAAAQRRGLYLDVDTTQGPQRLAFSGTPSRPGLQAFLESLDQHLAVPISSDAPGINYTNSRYDAVAIKSVRTDPSALQAGETLPSTAPNA